MRGMPKGADRFIREITKKAGAAVLRRFGKVGVKYMKSAALWDCVTEADLVADRMIVSAIKNKYPQHGIISEESGTHNPDAEYIWIIDPIDGTYNFATGVPLFGTMVCLVHKDAVILSAVDLPAMKESFYARAGKGAYCNGVRVRCSKAQRLHNSFGTGSSTVRARNARFLQKLIRAAKKADTQFGAIASMAVSACYTACGRRNWMVALNGKVWDFAPAYLMLKEAGCKVTDVNGRPWSLDTLEAVAANPTLHKKLLPLTRRI